MKYKLMSDIAVPYSSEEDVLKKEKIMSNLDFNNHIIYTNAYKSNGYENLENYKYDRGYVFWDGTGPAIGN